MSLTRNCIAYKLNKKVQYIGGIYDQLTDLTNFIKITQGNQTNFSKITQNNLD